MLKFKADPFLAEIQATDTADLMDRATAYREGLEPLAATMIDEELHRRGVAQAQIDIHADRCRRECLFDAHGVAFTCSQCRRPAIGEAATWHRLWGVVPLFPARVRYCKEHEPPA
jgi:hypothetical protein